MAIFLKNAVTFLKNAEAFSNNYWQSLDFPFITFIFVRTINRMNLYEKPFIPYHRNFIVHRMFAS